MMMLPLFRPVCKCPNTLRNIGRNVSGVILSGDVISDLKIIINSTYKESKSETI